MRDAIVVEFDKNVRDLKKRIKKENATKMKRILLFTIVAVLFAVPVFAAGDLTVQGNLVTNGSATIGGQLNIGTQGIKFSDNSVQTSASKLVWDYTVTGSSVSSLTSPTLAGLSDGGYDFEIVWVNAYAGQTEIYLYYNGDTTNGNYSCDFTRFQEGALSGARYANAEIGFTPQNTTDVIIGSVWITPGLLVGAVAHGNTQVQMFSQRRTAALTTDLTSVTIQTTQANAIGVGSRIRLWKKK